MKKLHSEIITQEKLNGVVLDVEFLLISVIQAAALASLAIHAGEPFAKMEYQYLPYVVSGFLFILTFWSQAIIHAISFIKWPLDLVHSFLYFLASLFEIMAFEHLTDPLWWFGFIFLFMFIAAILYLYDLRLMQKEKELFMDSKEKKRLFEHMISGQLYDLRFFLPAALFFNGGVFLVILWTKDLLANNSHVIVTSIQAFFGFVFLLNSMKNFRKRTQLISDCITP